MNVSRRFSFALCALLLAVGCSPAVVPTPPAPLDQLATRAVDVHTTATAQPPLPTAAPTPTASPSAVLQTPSPAPTAIPAFGEPAACREPAEIETFDQRLSYAALLFNPAVPLERLRLDWAWNATTQDYEHASELAAAFSVANMQPAYRIQELLAALHVAGFAAWLRDDPQQGLHILAVALRPGALDSAWGGYIRAYWANPSATPVDDPTVLPALKLTPCAWMVRQGYAPNLATGELENAAWAQPDFLTAGQPFLAATTAEAFQIARQINWLSDSEGESPVLMCGPLAWAILNRAAAFPPGYGAWLNNPKSFWLPKPSENGRPWSLFPPDLYDVYHFSDPISSFDFVRLPLHPGDMVYTYSGGDGFDHILVVTEVDSTGARYTVSNLIKIVPELDYSIRRISIYAPGDANAGAFRNEWAKDYNNGRTGHKGFEVFRWKWRTKDLSASAQSAVVLPGDSLPLLAARWRTPPLLIAAANGLDPAAPLEAGAALQIPPNPSP